jgi:hypothetical protein
MNYRELESQIQELIAKDEMELAIDLLREYFSKKDELKEILLQSGRYHALRKDHNNGTIEYALVQKTKNQLRESILDFIKTQEEEEKFRDQVFQPDESEKNKNLIPVFFSVGTPHKETQVAYIDKLKKHLLKYQVDLKTLDDDDWDALDPLNPIKKKMMDCMGCLVLAMERFYVKEGVDRRGSKRAADVKDQNYATPWSHIEAAMAYQLGLPFIILKEEDVKGEGMLDDNLFEWRIVKINPNTPEQLDEYPIKSFIRMWVEELKKMTRKQRYS